MTEELKQAAQQALMECPFCGSEPHDAHHIEYGRWAVTCRCGAKGASANTGPNATDAAKIKAYSDARTAWNTRALTQRPAAQEGEVDIKSRVSELIAEHGTLRAAARSLNIDVGYLSRLEHGDKVHPSSETLAKIGLRDAGVKYQRLVFLPTQPAAQATPDQFADASNKVAPVALRSVHLARDTAGMCVVRVNGRVAIRDNGDIIDHIATLEWFADTQQATPEPVQPFLVRDVAALLGASVPDVCKALAHLGHGQRSTNMEIKPEEALAVAEHIRAKAATPEPVGEQATMPRDAYDALERERDYWRTRARAMIDHAEGTCWYWMGDGSDHPESMVNSLPVVIRADQLRELMARPAPGVPPVTDDMLDAFVEVWSGQAVFFDWPEDRQEVLRQACSAMLAAAQAKGAGHE